MPGSDGTNLSYSLLDLDFSMPFSLYDPVLPFYPPFFILSFFLVFILFLALLLTDLLYSKLKIGSAFKFYLSFIFLELEKNLIALTFFFSFPIFYSFLIILYHKKKYFYISFIYIFNKIIQLNSIKANNIIYYKKYKKKELKKIK